MSKGTGKRIKTAKRDSGRAKFIIELIFAILLSISCALLGMSNLLFASNLDYPYTVDGFGHMTKVVYIAQQLAQGHIPSWFPYWYNNAATTQYYVPLSYYIMAPIYMITQNVMLTYKIFCALVMAIGAFGVWTICYRKIGRVCGLFGIIIFSFQPVLLESLYQSGVIAQGPIIALMPWYFGAIFSCAEKPKRSNYTASTILMTLIILSHAMHAFMVFLTTIIVIFIFLLLRKIRFRQFAIVGSTVIFAGVLTAFWSVVGSTQLENEGVPYLLPEATNIYTATIDWFFPHKAIFYFSLVTTSFIVLAMLLYFISFLRKKNNEQTKFYVNAAIILSFVTIVFSFGMNIPGFKYFPMAQSLVAGRILTYASVSAAIAAAYVIKSLWRVPKVSLLLKPIVIILIAASIWQMNPYEIKYDVISRDYYDTTAQYLDGNNDNFNKGRYQWYAAVGSTESFFPVQYDYNLSDGWNIEGTVHNQELWNNNIALSVGDEDYTIKQIAYWNVRYLLIYDEYKSLVEKLPRTKLNFVKTAQREEGSLYISEVPSSYYLTDSRNALVISGSTQGFNIEYPNFVLGKSADISKYSIDELLKYKLIYIIEPKLDTLSQKTELEAMITKVVNAGITVMVEPAATKNFELFGVNARDENYQSSPYISPTENCPYPITGAELKNNSNISVIRTLHGLNETYMNLSFQGSMIKNAVMGTENVGNGKVIFVGAHLSQYLKAVYARNFGLEMVDATIKENSDLVETIFDTIFQYYGVNKDYLPQTFDTVVSHQWGYEGGEFTYQSQEEKEVTLSVSYSPRWSATLDGTIINVGQCDNLVTLQLPAGEHTVKLHYGVTIYGMIGYIISAAGLLIFILFLLLWKWNMKVFTYISDGVGSYLQLNGSQVRKPGELSMNENETDNTTISEMEENLESNVEKGSVDNTSNVVTELAAAASDKEDKENIHKSSEEHVNNNIGTDFSIENDNYEERDKIKDTDRNKETESNENLYKKEESWIKDVDASLKIYNAIHENGVMVEVIEIDEEAEPATLASFEIQLTENEAAIGFTSEIEIEKEEFVPEAAITEEVTNQQAEVQPTAFDSKVTQSLEPIDYDKILKNARYESQRKWLTEYYEYLKANLEST